jgi:hypothetical protein
MFDLKSVLHTFILSLHHRQASKPAVLPLRIYPQATGASFVFISKNLKGNLSVGFDPCALHILKHFAFVSFQQGDGIPRRPQDKHDHDDGNRVSDSTVFCLCEIKR